MVKFTKGSASYFSCPQHYVYIADKSLIFQLAAILRILSTEYYSFKKTKGIRRCDCFLKDALNLGMWETLRIELNFRVRQTRTGIFAPLLTGYVTLRKLGISTEILSSHLQKSTNINSFTWLIWEENEIKSEKPRPPPPMYHAQHTAMLIN